MSDIWAYVAEDSIASADKLVDRLYETAQLIADNPRMGPARPDLAVGVRSFPVDRYVIIYRVIEDGVEVIRVLHGARDIRALFRGGR